MIEKDKPEYKLNYWDERYSATEYAFGTEPNEFFNEELDKLQPGTLLLPADGEGRNAVYAAGNGWQVTAFDQSTEAKRKAVKLAKIKETTIDFIISDMDDISFPDVYFDAIGIIYIHFLLEKRKTYHRKLLKYLKPGGIIILECFSKEQLRNSSGGPKDESMLLSKGVIEEDFFDLDIIKLDQKIITLTEGLFHQGEASVIRFVARKPI
jgi:SAM-dependent methyltransferase